MTSKIIVHYPNEYRNMKFDKILNHQFIMGGFNLELKTELNEEINKTYSTYEFKGEYSGERMPSDKELSKILCEIKSYQFDTNKLTIGIVSSI